MPQDETHSAQDRADLELIAKAVRAAAPIALKAFRPGRPAQAETWKKSHDQSIVTETDLAVNKALHEELTAARPDYGWLSEEDEDAQKRLSAKRVFIIDPIDGTRSFAEGVSDFCISVGLVEDGAPRAGVVFAPARDEFYAAHLGGGAWLNDEKLAVSAARPLEGAKAVGAKSAFRGQYWRDAPPQVALTYIHPLAYRLTQIANGAYDMLVMRSSAHEWDTAAGDLIVTEAGGVVSDAQGATPTYNKPTPRSGHTIAAGPALHQEIVSRLI